VEDHLELTDGVKGKLDESRREITAGKYTASQPENLHYVGNPREIYGRN